MLRWKSTCGVRIEFVVQKIIIKVILVLQTKLEICLFCYHLQCNRILKSYASSLYCSVDHLP
jgi:hypothetical protein